MPAGDVATPSWTLANLSIDRKLSWDGADALLFVKLNNAGDRLAFNAATIRGVRELSQLPGRSLLVGLRVAL